MTTHLLVGHVLDKLAELPPESVHCCVTSPPYFGLRDYGIEPQAWPDGWRGSLGLEPTPALYIEHMVAVFRAVRRVLRKDGTLWLNVGDSYAGGKTGNTNGGDNSGLMCDGRAETSRQRSNKKLEVAMSGMNFRKPQAADCKPKDLLGIPWMLAFALRDDGWYLRSEITWAKRAPMPESVTDRPTSATEKVFLLSRSPKYFYDAEAVKEDAADSVIARSIYKVGGTKEPKERGDNGRAQERSFADYVTGRNMRNWWLLGPEPFPEAHFATFPTEIPRRAILVGTSEKGVCPKCGAPWGRVINKRFVSDGKSANRHQASDSLVNCAKFADHGTWDNETIGWKPTCECSAGAPIPATILDPFFGAGTTGLVADQLQRDCIGIELNPAYAAMAERRITDDAPLFAHIEV